MSERLILQDLIDQLAKEKDLTKKDAEAFMRELISLVAETVETADSVKIKDFGTFKVVKVNSRKSVDVNTGAEIEIPAHYKLSFSPDKTLKEKVNAPFAHFESVVLEEGISFEDTNEVFETASAGQQDMDDELLDEDNDMAIEENASVAEAIVRSGLLDNLADKQAEEQIAAPAEEVAPQPEVEPEEIAPEPEAEEEVVAEPEAEVASEVREEVQPEEAVVPFVDSKDGSVEESPVYHPDREEGERDIDNGNDNDNDDFWYEEEKSKRKKIVIGVVLVALVVLAIIGWKYRGQILGNDRHVATIVQQSDTVQVAATDSLETNTGSVDTISSPVEPVEKDKPAGEYQTVTIGRGDTMRDLGLKYYGLKSFWVYIYEENKDKIINPNNVPLGTNIVIPPAEKYGINKYDPESVDKAKKREAQLYAEFANQP